MCQFANLIETTVNDYMNKGSCGYMFTAFDVTKEVRKHTKDRVTHEEVKKEVHNLFYNGKMPGYTRSLASLSGINPQPWIYHKTSSDPTLYTGQATYGASAVAQNTVPDNSLSSDSNTPVASPAILDSTYELDTTNRLCIPSKLVRQAGWSEGKSVGVYHTTKNELILTNDPAISQNLTSVTDYLVDRYDNIRVTRASLQKAGIDGLKFDIEGNNVRIAIRKA